MEEDDSSGGFLMKGGVTNIIMWIAVAWLACSDIMSVVVASTALAFVGNIMCTNMWASARR